MKLKMILRKILPFKNFTMAYNDLNVNMFWDYLRDCLLKLKYNYLGSHLFNGKIKQNLLLL